MNAVLILMGTRDAVLIVVMRGGSDCLLFPASGMIREVTLVILVTRANTVDQSPITKLRTSTRSPR